MGLLSAGLTAFYVRDASLLSSLPDLPTVPRLPHPRTFVSGSTVFFGVVCLIVILVLAYVTNPSESSFRTFLTEQAFRRHLHKLQDEDAYGDEESLEYDPSHPNNRTRKGKRFGAPRPRQSKPPSKPSMMGVNDSSTASYTRTPRFHFSNHLGVALQTPSHVFKSYGLCTIAVTQNVDTSSPYICSNTNRSQHTNGHPVVGTRAQNGHGLSNHPGHYETGGTQNSRIRGTWYIGAFGKWWIGGELTFLKEDLIQSIASANPAAVEEDADKPQADLKGGRYEVKSLDQVDAFSGLPIKSEDPVPLSQQTVPSPTVPKTRSRASTRSVKPTAIPLPSRGSTPPPPSIRTQVTISTPNGHKANGHSPISPKPESAKRKNKSRSNSNATQLNIPVPEEPSHPPDVVEMMKEITKSQAAVQDLRDQLSSFQQQTLASHTALRITLDDHRSRKKQDDVTRMDLKSRMKTLEESKRHADTGKRDADKKLKSAQATRDMAISRMQRLTGEAEAMKRRMENGEERIQKSKEEIAKVEEESLAEMEMKRAEIKSLEESIGSLGAKAKELEESLSNEKERLAILKNEVEEKKLLHQQQQQATLALALQVQQQQAEALASGFAGMEHVGLGGTVGLGVDPPAQQQTIWTGNLPVQTHTHNLNSAILSNSPSAFNIFEHSSPYSVQPPRRPSAEIVPLADKQQLAAAAQSRIRSVSLGELSSMTQAAMAAGREHSANITPSDEAFSHFRGDENQIRTDPSYSSLNISTAGLLPSNLVNSIETESPLSILTPNAAANTRESRWRTGMWPWRSDNLFKSTPASGSSGGKDFDPFDSKPPSLKSQPGPPEETASLAPKPVTPGPRRWFSRSTTTSMNGPGMAEPPSQIISAPEGLSPSKSRLNPDAKVFSLPKGRNLLSSTMWTLDGMTPMPPPTNVHPGPLHLLTPPADNPISSFSSGSSLPVPTPATGTSSATAPPATKPRFRGLFSSPFAPSPAEREALQRALEKNLSHDRISITSDGSGEGSNLRLPPSPFGLPPPNPSLFDVDEEESDSGWASVLKSRKKKESANSEGKAKELTK